jgi:hypothetical protein
VGCSACFHVETQALTAAADKPGIAAARPPLLLLLLRSLVVLVVGPLQLLLAVSDILGLVAGISC